MLTGARPQARTTRWFWRWTGVFLVVYVIVGMLTFSPESSAIIPGSTFTSAPSGSMALERLWQSLGLGFEEWEQIPAFLPNRPGAVFVSVSPQSSQYRPQDIEQLFRYAAAGHTVVWADNKTNPLFSKLRVRIRSSSANMAISQITVLGGTKQDVLWKHIQASTHYWLAGPGLKNATVLYSGSGKSIGAKFAYGKGTVILWSAPSFFENGTIGKAGNFQTVWNLIGNRSLLWDEYGHGFARQSTLGWMFHGVNAVSAVLGIAAFLLYLYRQLWRFGPVRNPSLPAALSATAYVDALAWHLQRKNLRKEQFRRIVAVTKGRLESVTACHSSHPTGEAPGIYAFAQTGTNVLKQWRNLANQGYQSRQWRKFLRLTLRLWQDLALQQIRPHAHFEGGRRSWKRTKGVNN